MSNRVYTRSADLMEAELGDEMVALDPQQGKCFGFNEVATWVWHRLNRPATFDQLRDELLEEYEVGEQECSKDLNELLDILVQKRLVACSSEPGN